MRATRIVLPLAAVILATFAIANASGSTREDQASKPIVIGFAVGKQASSSPTTCPATTHGGS